MRYEEKVPNGKMVCFDVECKEGKTTKVLITGDFFLHPEDAIAGIEKSLTGISADCTEIQQKISGALGNAELIGATPEDLARIFRKAVLCGE
ncbi:biotin--protein ligase [Candidatus Micrarchaeota archaeon]|nr:biotin--protein ligase [Candidatus Micrarchaeota archaeon]